MARRAAQGWTESYRFVRALGGSSALRKAFTAHTGIRPLLRRVWLMYRGNCFSELERSQTSTSSCYAGPQQPFLREIIIAVAAFNTLVFLERWVSGRTGVTRISRKSHRGDARIICQKGGERCFATMGAATTKEPRTITKFGCALLLQIQPHTSWTYVPSAKELFLRLFLGGETNRIAGSFTVESAHFPQRKFSVRCCQGVHCVGIMDLERKFRLTLLQRCSVAISLPLLFAHAAG